MSVETLPATRRPRVALVNPPGPRDLYRGVECTYFVKGGYQIHPLHFVMLTGVLGRSSHDFAHFDALMAGQGERELLAELRRHRPDAIVAIASSLNWPDDRAFLVRCKEALPEVPLIALGEVFHDERFRDFDRLPGVDGLLVDYVDHDLARFLRCGESHSYGLVRPGAPRGPHATSASFRIEPPRHDLFDHPRFRMPFLRRRRYATVLGTHGCPYTCQFCPLPNMRFRHRPADDVRAELEELAASGIEELAIYDPTFGVPRAEALALLERMSRMRFGWWCQSRVDVLDDELLAAMRRAGCHTVSLGIESHDAEVLGRLGKHHAVDVAERVRTIRGHGIRTCGNFVLGFPGQDVADCEDTVRFALDLDLDFATFNVASPFTGTEMRERLVDDGVLGGSELGYDNARSLISLGGIAPETLARIRDRAFRRFFLRPHLLARRLAGLRTWDELVLQLGPALGLLGRNPAGPRRLRAASSGFEDRSVGPEDVAPVPEHESEAHVVA